MSEKVISFGDSSGNSAVITFPRKARLLSLYFLLTTTSTNGSRIPIVTYRLPTTDNEFAQAISAFNSSNALAQYYADITATPYFDSSQFPDVYSIPAIDIPAGGSILLFDEADIDVLDVFADVGIVYDDGLIEPDPNIPTMV